MKLLIHRAGRILVSLATVAIFHTAHGQGKMPDSIDFKKLHFTQNRFVNNIFQQAINSVRRAPESDDSYLNGKSEDPYLPYQGKVIRKINIEPYGFNRSFYDTSRRDSSWAARAGDRLHRTTRKFVIRDNLFIQEHTPLNAFKIADNERHIRSLEFIQDARIVVDSVKGSSDSVDVTIYTKDFFSIGGGGSSAGFNHIMLNLYDANFMGIGQRLEASGLYDYNRHPNFGYGTYYKKNSIFHSFIDGSAGYSVMNISDYTHVEESVSFLSLSRRLVSPYSRVAGGFTLSNNKAHNLYYDTSTRMYEYNLLDVWIGYNIGIRKLTASNNTIRDRRFLAFRYFNRDFKEVPKQADNIFDPVYNSSQALLGQFTFFRQDYYKTQYIYGFGTTEDLPYGYNISITGGWHKQLNLERPYGGISVSQYIATHRGDFIQLYLRTGGFLYKGNLQDGSFLVGGTAYSRILFWNSTKIRQYINVSYSEIYNRLTIEPLRIDNYYGLRGFLSDSASGGKRLSMQLETAFYLKYKLLGFQFAPFPYIDMSLLTPEHANFNKSAFHTSIGGGVRARNENLIFETIELRAYYFPEAPSDMNNFKVIVRANIRFRYSSNFIVAPAIIRLNAQ